MIGSLSKGYQQKVGIAQAIVHEPDVVILDEPTVGLDPNQVREMRTLIRELRDRHSAILSTHILPEVEAVCDRVEIMHQGRYRVQRYDRGVAPVPRWAGVADRSAPCAPALEQIAQLRGVADTETAGSHLLYDQRPCLTPFFPKGKPGTRPGGVPSSLRSG